jgi:hypothetical protein
MADFLPTSLLYISILLSSVHNASLALADDDDPLFVLAETTNSLPLYTHLGTPLVLAQKGCHVTLISP